MLKAVLRFGVGSDRCRSRVPPVENRHVAKLELIMSLNVPELEIRLNLDNPDDSDAKERLSCNK